MIAQRAAPLAILVFFLGCLPAQAQDSDLEALIREIDEMYRSETSEAEVEMVVTRPRHQNTIRMKVWTRGMDDTFIRISSPSKLKGMATLKLEKEMWNYMPRINKVTKISASMMLGSWMGSDFTNDDLVKESSYADDYTYRKLEDAPEAKILIELDPKPDAPVVWGRILMTVTEASRQIEKMEYFEEGGEKVRELTFTEVTELGGRQIPSRLTMVPLNKSGHSTEIFYRRFEFDKEMPDRVFTLSHLRSRR